MNQQQLHDFNNRYLNTNANNTIKGNQLNTFNNAMIDFVFSGASNYGWTTGETITYLEENYYTSGQTDQAIYNAVSGITDTSLSAALQTEISDRIFVDDLLYGSLSTEIDNRVSDTTSLSTAITGETSSRVSGDVSLTSRYTALSNTLFLQMSNEVLARSQGDSAINYSLSVGLSSSVSRDASLSTAIGSVSSGTTFDPTSLTTRISSEEVTRSSVDSSLSASILSHSGSTYDDSSLSTALSSEIVTRDSADLSLSTSIVNIPVYDDSSLSTALSSEEVTRSSADLSLSTSIVNIPIYDDSSISTALSSEEVIRSSVDSSLSSAISSVISGNTYDDSSLSTAIVNEVSTRSSADLSLSTAIINNTPTSLSIVVSNEINSRISGDTSLSSLITTEVSTRTSNVTSLSSSITTEVSTRTSNVTSLSTSISSVSGVTLWTSTDLSVVLGDGQVLMKSGTTLVGYTIPTGGTSYNDSSISTALSSEVNTRTSNVTSLSTSIVSEVSTRSSADTSLASFAQQPWIDINRCGFVNNSETSILFNSATTTFTLSGLTSSWSYYRAGIKYTISGTKSIAIPTSANTYYITINNTTGTLESGTTAWTLQDAVIPVVTIRYNSAYTPTYLLADERHTIKIDRQTHLYEHLTNGTQFISGGVLDGPTLTPAVPTDITNTFGLVGTSTIADEDLFTDIPAFTRTSGTTNVYMHFLRSGTTTWYWKLDNMPYTSGATGYINYDLNGSLAVGRDARWYNTYLIFDNIKDQPMAIIHGRGEFTSLLLAQAESPLTFNLTNLPVIESILVYQFTWNTNNTYNNKGKCRLASSPKLLNISSTSVIGSGAGTDHNTLAGLQGGSASEFYHLTNADYLKVTGLTASLSAETSQRISSDTSIMSVVNGMTNFNGAYNALVYNTSTPNIIYANYTGWTSVGQYDLIGWKVYNWGGAGRMTLYLYGAQYGAIGKTTEIVIEDPDNYQYPLDFYTDSGYMYMFGTYDPTKINIINVATSYRSPGYIVYYITIIQPTI